MLASLERFFKQAFLDNDRLVVAASLATIYHFAADNAEPVKRWSSEIVQYVSSASSKINLSIFGSWHCFPNSSKRSCFIDENFPTSSNEFQ